MRGEEDKFLAINDVVDNIPRRVFGCRGEDVSDESEMNSNGVSALKFQA